VTQKVHGNTKKAADMALVRREISRDSHRAVHEGRISLAQARELGRDRGPDDTGQASSGREEARTGPREDRERPQEGTGAPPQPISRISKDDTTQECWCGCGEQTKPHRRWKPGHDQRAKGIISRAVAAGKTGELSDQLRDYGQERRLI
jgi:hypothetical protein